jgi:hypothetical protein
MAKVENTVEMIEFLREKLSEDDLKIAAKMFLDVCKEYADHEIKKQISIYSVN